MIANGEVKQAPQCTHLQSSTLQMGVLQWDTGPREEGAWGLVGVGGDGIKRHCREVGRDCIYQLLASSGKVGLGSLVW